PQLTDAHLHAVARQLGRRHGELLRQLSQLRLRLSREAKRNLRRLAWGCAGALVAPTLALVVRGAEPLGFDWLGAAWVRAGHEASEETGPDSAAPVPRAWMPRLAG